MLFNHNGDFDANLGFAKKRCIIIISVLSLLLLGVWCISQYGILQPIIQGGGKMVLQYISMLATGFCVWYGYYNYDKTASLLREKDSEPEKEENYLKALDFKNVLIYAAWILDIICYLLTSDYQFGLTSVICLLFSLGCLPSYSKFENDFYKPIYLDEEFNQEDDEK